ncbi:MAG: hypothetical protein Q3966_06620 [Neisseria sp.]|nr:hypothetical protein [Neisseria sp.]
MPHDQDPRLPFLNRLLCVVQRLPEAAVLSHDFAEYAPLPGISLLLMHPDCDGPLAVSAVSLRDGDVVFQPFPAGGVPHWRLDCEGGEVLYTCDVDKAVGYVENWLGFCQNLCLAGGDLPLRTAAADLPAPSAVLPQQVVWQEVGPPCAADWPGEDKAALAADGAAADRGRIAAGFPRDRRGNAARGSAVVLAWYGGAVGYMRRRPALVAKAVAKNTLVLAADRLIVENQEHCWADERWRWHGGEAWPPESVRNGTAGDEERAAQASAALAEGRFDEALALYGIGWDRYLAQVLYGLPLNVHDAAHCADWRQELIGLLAKLAPWRLARVAPPGKRRPRLLLFSGQRHQRKAAVLLERHKGGLRLAVDYSGGNERLPESAFLRGR